jgi:hypothetical protein
MEGLGDVNAIISPRLTPWGWLAATSQNTSSKAALRGRLPPKLAAPPGLVEIFCGQFGVAGYGFAPHLLGFLFLAVGFEGVAEV